MFWRERSDLVAVAYMFAVQAVYGFWFNVARLCNCACKYINESAGMFACRSFGCQFDQSLRFVAVLDENCLSFASSPGLFDVRFHLVANVLSQGLVGDYWVAVVLSENHRGEGLVFW